MVINSRLSIKDFTTKNSMSNGWQIPEIVQVNLAIRTRVAVVSVHEKIEKKSERKSLAEAVFACVSASMAGVA